MNTKILLSTTLIITSISLASAVDAGKLPPASKRTDLTFANDIKPLFDDSCINCHGPKKAKGKLRLDTLKAVLKGGEEGKVIVPGKSADSELVVKVARLGDADEAMPPEGKGNPLTADQVGLIRAWIDQGAK